MHSVHMCAPCTPVRMCMQPPWLYGQCFCMMQWMGFLRWCLQVPQVSQAAPTCAHSRAGACAGIHMHRLVQES